MGPLLGLESETQYSICFLAVAGFKGASRQDSMAKLLSASKQADTPRGVFWRAVWSATPKALASTVDYEILLDGVPARDLAGASQWQFHLPGQEERVRIGYASCNGFSDFKLLTSTTQPYVMWDRLAAEHRDHPLSLLLMGGDQVYADSLWTSVPTLKAWNELDRVDKVKRKATRTMVEQLHRFYCELDCRQWSRPRVATTLSPVPSVMIWDDHDIFDGWGSYPADLQGCEVYQAIYAAAASISGCSSCAPLPMSSRWIRRTRPITPGDCVSGGYQILALDNRATRSQNQVMSREQWDQINGALAHCGEAHLLVMTGGARGLSGFLLHQAAFDATPWRRELTDDLSVSLARQVTPGGAGPASSCGCWTMPGCGARPSRERIRYSPRP